MLYQFKAIKAVKDKDGNIKNIQIVAFTESDSSKFKSIMAAHGLSILSFSQFPNKPLGNIYEVELYNKEKDETINIIFPVEGKLREAFRYFVDTFGLLDYIKYIKPYQQDIDEKRLELILQKLKDELKKEREIAGKGPDVGPVGSDNGDNNGPKIGKSVEKQLHKDVDDFIAEMQELLSKTFPIFPVESKKIEDILGQLKKYKTSTNINKLAEYYKQGLELAEDLYDKYFSTLKKEEEKKMSDDLITELDIIAEYKTYQQVQRAKSLEKVNAKEFGFPWYKTLYYRLFGKAGIYLKLLIEEQIRKYHLNYFSFLDVLTFLEFVSLFLLIEYSLTLFYTSLSSELDKTNYFLYMFVMFGRFGFVVILTKIVYRKNKFWAIVLFIALLFGWRFVKLYFGF